MMENQTELKPRFSLLLLLLICMLGLTSCSHLSKHDGPPQYYVDETRVPNAIPRCEPHAKYGNMRCYHVLGKRYYTLKSSKNYEAVGIASWYGTKFHAKRTSSGERYNMLSMTAAHKSLPLPTYVEVTNLKNHRKIIVKVNDRGPFKSNRIIDLSYVAAKKLHMLGPGTALVRVKAIDPRTYGKPLRFANNTAAHSHFSKPVYLQVGSFRKKAHAKQLQRELFALLQTPVSMKKKRGSWYHVEVGPVRGVAALNRITRRLKILGIRPTQL